MQLLPLCTFITAALGAATHPVQKSSRQTTTNAKKVLIGGGPTGMVGAADFDGSQFTIVANDTIPKTSPNWLLFKEPNLLYAVDENSKTTRLFNFDPATNELALVQNATGSSGVVFLEFNQDKTIMAGAAFSQGAVDFWDVSAADGTMTLIKSVDVGGAPGPVVGRQDSPREYHLFPYLP